MERDRKESDYRDDYSKFDKRVGGRNRSGGLKKIMAGKYREERI